MLYGKKDRNIHSPERAEYRSFTKPVQMKTKIFISVLFLFALFSCESRNNKVSATTTSPFPDKIITAHGYELRGHALDEFNKIRKENGRPAVFLIEVFEGTSTLYFFENGKIDTENRW